MFKFLRKTADLAVDVAGGIAKGTIKASTTVGTAVVAESIRFATGKNEIADFMWDVQEKTSKATDFVVDRAAKPVARAIAKAPIRKTELVYKIGKGTSKVIFTDNKEEGMKELKTAGALLTVSVVTGGVLAAGMEMVEEAVGEHVEEAVAGFFSDAADSHASNVASFAEPRFGGLNLAHSVVDVSPENQPDFLEALKGEAANNGKQSLISMIDSWHEGDQSQFEKIAKFASKQLGEDKVRILDLRFGGNKI